MSEISASSTGTDTQIEDPVDDGELNQPQEQSQVRWRFAGALRSDVGSVRQRNEDSGLLYDFESDGHAPLPPFGLYMVADGMGGYDGGDRASKIATRTAAQHLLQHIYLPLLQGDTFPNEAAVEQALRGAVTSAHEAVQSPGYAGNGGTTLTIAVVLGPQLYLAHVGDSRAYWLVDGQLEPLTKDHSLVQRLQDAGRLTAEEAENFQYRNILMRALGQDEDLEVDVYSYGMPRQGKLLLCSDGLCGQVPDAAIAQIMNQTLSPDKVAGELISAALEAGGWDNITALVVEFKV